VIKEESHESRAEVKSFTLKEETRPENLPDVSGVAKFDASKLKHVETQEKTVLPTADVIKEESHESRAEVKSFDRSSLKHVETDEKNPLPTAATLKEETRPENLPDVSGVADFDASKLKHVKTQEKQVLPTTDGRYTFTTCR
jgi:hypothetical protein